MSTVQVAIQMDPIAHIDIAGDSTFVLALEAQARGYALWHYLPHHLSLENGAVVAQAQPLTVRRESGNHFTLGPEQRIALADMDVVLMRQDPPFDMAYITATYLLETLGPRPLVVNDPLHVRNAPEKLFATRYPDLMPPTLVSSDRAALHAFRAQYQDIILKPLYGNGGAGIFHIRPDDDNFNVVLETFTQLYREPLVAQQYLPAVRQGDKRIILVEGAPIGAINRVPAEGEARSNMHVGGRAMAADLTARDREICARIGPALRERGLLFAGIDVIGPYLTEINVTSPTGLQELARFTGGRPEAQVWDAIDARRKS